MKKLKKLSALACAGIIGLSMAGSPAMAATDSGDGEVDAYYTVGSVNADQLVMVLPTNSSFTKGMDYAKKTMYLRMADANQDLPENLNYQLGIYSEGEGKFQTLDDYKSTGGTYLGEADTQHYYSVLYKNGNSTSVGNSTGVWNENGGKPYWNHEKNSGNPAGDPGKTHTVKYINWNTTAATDETKYGAKVTKKSGNYFLVDERTTATQGPYDYEANPANDAIPGTGKYKKYEIMDFMRREGETVEAATDNTKASAAYQLEDIGKNGDVFKDVMHFKLFGVTGDGL